MKLSAQVLAMSVLLEKAALRFPVATAPALSRTSLAP